jgi:hypothetical protein
MSAHTGGITPLRKLTQPAISTNYCCHEHAEEIFKPLPVNSSLIKIIIILFFKMYRSE